jgi:glucosamine-6-phosphate deaminase
VKYQVLETAELASRAVANEIIKQVVARPNSLLGLATGSTPLGVYKILVEQSQLGLVDFSSVQVCLLDEYVGLSADSEQSHQREFHRPGWPTQSRRAWPEW